MNFPYPTPQNAPLRDRPIDFGVRKGTYYDMKNLQERHKEILRRLTLGESKGAIADALGITVATVRYVERSSLGSQYLEKVRDGREQSTISVAEQITQLAPDALDVIRDTIKGRMEVAIVNKETGKLENVEIAVAPKLRVDAAKDVLSRAGYVPPTKVEHSLDANTSTNEIIAAAKEKIAKERLKAVVNVAEEIEFTEIQKGK